jgi:ATP/maltotriose-dependent transcriptional regulator MalT
LPFLPKIKSLDLNNTLLNNQWVKEEIKWKIRNYLKTNENLNTANSKLLNAANAILGKKFTVREKKPIIIRKILNKQSEFTTQERRKRTNSAPRVSLTKEIKRI